jgi:hypothetical protein
VEPAEKGGKGREGKSRVMRSNQGGARVPTGDGCASLTRESRAHSSSASGLHLILSNSCEVVP